MAGQDDISIQSLKYYNDFNGQIALFEQAYNFVLGPDQTDTPNPQNLEPEVFTAAAAPLVLQGVLQAISAFRTDVTLRSIDVELDDSILVAQLAALFEKDQNKMVTIDPGIPNPETSNRTISNPGISNPETSDRTASNPSCIPPKTGKTRIFYPNLFPIYLSQGEGQDQCEKIITKKLENISNRALQGKLIIQELESKQKELKKDGSDLDEEDKKKANQFIYAR
ncbi:hypothetical protein HRE53_12650 [Acaryochloris sp. 'Moss Beach']|uniref:hypothetical protein n=1 Tax=Acaryochloris sp. 'Moss Beach' TaxID=2740837 RepID=UPI001F18C693|nr:hypothetical protein [Acaryochloris sp. 'Moss Beach']UJB71724.1 hypothetical protein HRE53_12650 [Acaryochloris sp. 'Moss Beach']